MSRRAFAPRPSRAKKTGYICLRGHELLRSLVRPIYCPTCDRRERRA